MHPPRSDKLFATTLARGAVLRHGEWFAEAVEQSSLPVLLGEHERRAVVAALGRSHEATHAQVEIVIAALAKIPPGHVSSVPQGHVQEILEEAGKLIECVPGTMGPLTAALRMLKGLRPAWLTAPVYTELLEPFSDLCDEVLGKTPGDLIQRAAQMEEPGDLERPCPDDLPDALLERIATRLDDIEGPADLHYRVFVEIEDGWSYCFRYKAVEVFYRAIVSLLHERSRSFANRRGKALEEFVARRLSEVAPSWTMLRGEHLSGREKDIIAWDDDAGVAVECKCLRLRDQGTGWSKLHLESDVRTIQAAITQVEAAKNALRKGASTNAENSIPRRSIVQGLVVTDEPYAPFIRAGLDRLHIDDATDDWHGQDTWVGSVVDFHYLLSKSETISVFLHYLMHHRNRSWLRADDEPEAWSLYCAAGTHMMAKAGVRLAIQEHNWERERGEGPDSFKPQWLHRMPLVATFDERRSSKKGMRIIQQDLDRAIRDEKERLNAHKDPDAEPVDEETMKAIQAMIEKQEAERAGRAKFPFDHL